jgi:16S rRNA processing protein RimM
VLVAGVVARPHGLDGSFYVNAPQVALLTLGASVTVDGAGATILRRAGTDAHPILRLSIAGDRTGAERLRGKELLVTEVDAPPLGPDEYRAADLVGARVVDGTLELGVVRALIALPSCECLSVARSAGGSDLLVPLVRDAVRSIDVERAVIDVDCVFLGEGA